MEKSYSFNQRSRNWFLCIQEGATCYNHLPEILDRFDTDKCTYAYIKHDAETYSISDNLDSEMKEVEGKKEHYHVLLCFENSRTFSSITKHFKGAHVEVSHCLADCANYLLHNTEASRKAGKKIYSFDQICTNNKDALASWLGSRGLRYEVFNENKIIEYILCKDCLSITAFYMRFGSAIQRYIPLITQLLKEYNSDANIDAQKYIKQQMNKYSYDDANVYNVQSVEGSIYDDLSTIYCSSHVLIWVCSQHYRLSDLIINQNLFEIADEDCIRILMSDNRFGEKRNRLDIDKLQGFDWSVIRSFLLDLKANYLL